MNIGSLFSGYGGLDMAVQSVIGGELAWYSDIDPAACTILAAHHPEVPNLGDITTVDWATVPPVDVLTGGYPCQPFSQAGQRKGRHDERHLWPYVCAAIDALRPGLVILENVRGHLSLGFGDVLADLSRVGYDARWGVVRASDAGAPHGRARIFITAYPDRTGLQGHADPAGAASAGRYGHAQPSPDVPPADSDCHRHGGALHARGMGSLEGREEGHPRQRERARGIADTGGGGGVKWGKYGPAIHRWERVLGRRSPEPTTVGANGRPRLSPQFVEWLMGLPAGHVTGHGLRPAQELKALGNGVVPQQAALALRLLLEPTCT